MVKMNRIGILYSENEAFAEAVLRSIYETGGPDTPAEVARIDQVTEARDPDYRVIVDLVTPRVPFYTSFLGAAALVGTAVLNNPFRPGAGERFLPLCLAAKLGIPVARTGLLPSRELPYGASPATFRNLTYPLDWEGIFDHVGFPARLKPLAPDDGASCVVHDETDFFRRQSATGPKAMLLQQEVPSEDRFNCFCVGSETRVSAADPGSAEPAFEARLAGDAARLARFLGYDLLSVETVLHDGVPYVVAAGDPVLPADPDGEDFRWLAEQVAVCAVRRARTWHPGADNLTWGLYQQRAVNSQQFGRWTPLPETDENARGL